MAMLAGNTAVGIMTSAGAVSVGSIPSDISVDRRCDEAKDKAKGDLLHIVYCRAVAQCCCFQCGLLGFELAGD